MNILRIIISEIQASFCEKNEKFTLSYLFMEIFILFYKKMAFLKCFSQKMAYISETIIDRMFIFFYFLDLFKC